MKLLTAGLIVLKLIAISLLVGTYYGVVDAVITTCTADTQCTGIGANSKCCWYFRPTGTTTRICSANVAADKLQTNGLDD